MFKKSVSIPVKIIYGCDAKKNQPLHATKIFLHGGKDMEQCPCGTGKSYTECCEPLIKGDEAAKTAEALMRSRYTAHAKSEIDYIYDTTHPDKREGYDRDGVAAWTKKSEWQSLEIIKSKDGGTEDQEGVVEFVARYREKGKPVRHHEVAEFSKVDDQWYFTDGNTPKPVTMVRQGPKTGRNDPCTCGSGKKFKKCCGR